MTRKRPNPQDPSRVRLQVPAVPGLLHAEAKAEADRQGISFRHFIINCICAAVGRKPYPKAPAHYEKE